MSDVFVEGIFDGMEKVAGMSIGEKKAVMEKVREAGGLRSEKGYAIARAAAKESMNKLEQSGSRPSALSGAPFMHLKPKSIKERIKGAVDKFKALPRGKKLMYGGGAALGAAAAGYGGYKLYKHLKNKKKNKR